jgi:hypothetical protein
MGRGEGGLGADGRILRFCDGARARFDPCGDFGAKRQFLLDHVEKVIYLRGKVTIVARLPAHRWWGSGRVAVSNRGRVQKVKLKPAARVQVSTANRVTRVAGRSSANHLQNREVRSWASFWSPISPWRG